MYIFDFSDWGGPDPQSLESEGRQAEAAIF